MRRREFIGLVGGVAVAWPLAARAQQKDKLPRIAFLTSTSPEKNASSVEGFRQGLNDLGYNSAIRDQEPFTYVVL